MCILEILVFFKIKQVPLLTFYKHYGYNEHCNIIIMSCYPKTKNNTDRNRHTKSIYPVVFLYTLIHYTCSISSFHGMFRFQCISKNTALGRSMPHPPITLQAMENQVNVIKCCCHCCTTPWCSTHCALLVELLTTSEWSS